ncbi:uncharacterized protein LOC132307585 [Cornus florida]|uniref:uncharacterized protein LOC132307585 n=1 Tax=Cornus florida TaxID=4283 RepID=UPI00289DC69C|nr:uncharacterized protein LOC132307585 [Cornus florida]
MLPASVFRCQTLRVLEHNNYEFGANSITAFQGCVNLTTLKLISVRMSTPDSLFTIISNCGFLENLSLCSCTGLIDLKINSHHKLKFLELRSLFLENMVICGKGVTILLLDHVSIGSTSVYIKCPNLRLLRFNKCRNFTISEIFKGCYDLDQSLLPASVHRCDTLRVLELGSEDNKLIPESIAAFQGCVHLTTLKLIHIPISPDSLFRIKSHCEFLENLSLCSCIGLNVLKISDHKLKFFELRNFDTNEVDICGNGVTVLVVHNVETSSRRFFINCPNLRVFQAHKNITNLTNSEIQKDITNLTNSEILERCSGLLRSSTEHGGDYLSMANLRELCTELDLNDLRDNVLLAFIFSASAHLQKIYITNQANANSRERKLPYDQAKFWEKRELSDSITHQLRVVWIRGFAGKEREMRLASHLIKNATMLEKIVIQWNYNRSPERVVAAKVLQSLPKASKNASVILEPGH